MRATPTCVPAVFVADGDVACRGGSGVARVSLVSQRSERGPRGQRDQQNQGTQRGPAGKARRRPRNPSPQSAADLLPQVVARIGGDDRALEQRVSLAWPDAVGALLSRRTCPESVRGKTLIVRVDSSAFAHELALLKREILERLRRVLGDGLLEDLRTRVGPLPGQI
jgi:predicted nucleic acid-binding Zn ribbon protein